MFDAKTILDQLMKIGSDSVNSPQSQDSNQGKSGLDPILQTVLTGIGGGMLGNLLSSKGGSSPLAKAGGAATLAAVAYRFYQNYKANTSQNNSGNPSSQQAMDFDFDLGDVAEPSQDDALAMLVAMINAAKADGVYDDQEKEMIKEQIDKVSHDAEAVAWIQAELKKPLDVSYVASFAKTPEIATQIYLVSLTICRNQNDKERLYLQNLSQALRLEPGLKASLEQQFI